MRIPFANRLVLIKAIPVNGNRRALKIAVLDYRPLYSSTMEHVRDLAKSAGMTLEEVKRVAGTL